MDNNKIQKIIDESLKENPCEVDIRYNEPMMKHTTFKVGGNADCWVCPDGEGFTSFCVTLLSRSRRAGVPVFVLGAGANIVVSDKGIRGIVLDMGSWNGESVWALCASEGELILKSGTSIDEAVDTAASASLSGFEFLAGMPGTVGGAIWMNARCYNKEIVDVLSWVEVICIEEPGNDNCEYVVKRIETEQGSGFDYKKSPFQQMECVILSAAFKLKKGDKKKILIEMEKNREDRDEKGHYLFPCAGSAFKNNRDFGKPTGQIIDELGLKGYQKGGAQIAPFHGNIVINTGNAAASDIRALVDDVVINVKTTTGFTLEPEILFIGEW